MPIKNILDNVKDRLELFLANNNITDYEIIIGEREIVDDKLYLGITTDGINFRRISTQGILPNYIVNITVSKRGTYEEFIDNYSGMIELLTLFLFRALAVTEINVTELAFDDVNQVMFATIRISVGVGIGQ